MNRMCRQSGLASAICPLSWLLSIGATCVLIVGCGGGQFDIAPVSGQVTLDGQPLANADVSFEPVASGATTGAPGAFATTDSDGKFGLKTATKPSRDGAVLGKYVVRISLAGDDSDDSGRARPNGPRLPKESGDGSLTFEVTPEGTDAANFDLKSK